MTHLSKTLADLFAPRAATRRTPAWIADEDAYYAAHAGPERPAWLRLPALPGIYLNYRRPASTRHA